QLGGRLPAEERAVVRLQDGRELLVPGLVVPDRDAGDAAPPEPGMLAELEQRDVSAPGVAGDHGSVRIGKPSRDEVAEAGIDVLQLRAADVADERVPPLPAIAYRAAVVHPPD